MAAPATGRLLEREGFLEALEQMHAATVRGSGRLVLIAAEAGGGKTALVEAFRDQLSGQTRYLSGACDVPFTPRPLGPLVEFAPIRFPQARERRASRRGPGPRRGRPGPRRAPHE